MIQAWAVYDQATVNLVIVGRTWSTRTFVDAIRLWASDPSRNWTRIVRRTIVGPVGSVHDVAAAIGCQALKALVPLAMRISVAGDAWSAHVKLSVTFRTLVGDGATASRVTVGAPKTLPIAVQYSGRPVE